MESCIGKTYAEIWEAFIRKHGSLPEADLKRIHQKWKTITATS